MSYYCIIVFAVTYSFTYGYHIILDPAGDNKHTGRTLATCYERSITRQICDALKKKLAQDAPSWRVTITHTAGESLAQEQRAQIANKGNADLFIHISCFEDTSIKPHIMNYYPIQTTPLHYTPQPYTFIPAHRAHEIQSSKTEKWISTFNSHLQKQSSVYTILTPYAIPDARLKYIQIPSCTIEIGISPLFPWITCIDMLCNAFIESIRVS